LAWEVRLYYNNNGALVWLSGENSVPR
jgi:hypothetical protein